MLLKGLDPKSERGKEIYFEKYQWNPLWSYCFAACGAEKGIVGLDEFSNGMYYRKKVFSAKKAARLAEVLRGKMDRGELQTFFRHQRWNLQDLEREICSCKGIGCLQCNMRGFRIPEHSRYRFHPDDVQAFVDFLSDCGGFEFI